jgi:hypothetical protein
MTMFAFAFLQYRRLNQACRPSVTSLDRRRSDARTAENGSVTNMQVI